MSADLIFVHGTILTMADGEAEALAIRDGRILAVGRDSEIQDLASPRTEVVDLAGKALLPGFIDAHTHLVHDGVKESGYELDLSDAGSREAALERVRAAAAEREAGTWVQGHGWDESTWPERRYLVKDDLDRVAPEHPVALTRVDGHLLVANSRALGLIRVDADPDEFDAERGILREGAATRFKDEIPIEDEAIEGAIRVASRKAYVLGVTAVHDIVGARELRAYQRLSRRGELGLRVRLSPLVELLDSLTELGFGSGFGDETLHLGAIKIFSDGSIGARNAALLEPYADEPGSSGKLNYPQETLNDLVKRSRDAGFQLMVHAIGDRAISAALEAFQAAGVARQDRARIEHLELPTDEQLQKMRELGAIASMQPNFLQWSGADGMYEARVGPERDRRIDPHRGVLERGIPLAFGSDTMPFGPLYGIHHAVHAPHPDQRLSVEEALHAYTSGGAFAGFQETAVGTIEPGKRADVIVLSHDPRSEPERLGETRVLQTFVGGARVYAIDA